MTFSLQPDEWTLLENVAREDLIQFVADLDVIIPAGEIDRRALFELAIPKVVARIRAEGIPLTKYDREDLEALSTDELGALCTLAGVRRPTVSGLMKAGVKVYKTRQKVKQGSDPYAFMIPMLLAPVIRCAMEA
jgi:hypothetical protein